MRYNGEILCASALQQKKIVPFLVVPPVPSERYKLFNRY